MEDEDFPEELRDAVKKLEVGLIDLENGFSGLIKQNREEFYQVGIFLFGYKQCKIRSYFIIHCVSPLVRNDIRGM